MPTPRELAHAATLERILALGRIQLAEVGPQSLSLRAIARELGVSSSAVYRYVASRDDLLTRLITAAYDSLGDTVEQADAAFPRHDHIGRWRASCHALRSWAKANPHEWALIYGSPVPAYAAPQDTIEPATRVARTLLAIIEDADLPAAAPCPEGELSDQMEALLRTLDSSLDAGTMLALVRAWTQLLGTTSLELFGHLVGSVDPADAYYDDLIGRLAASLGVSDPVEK